jgi:monoterpene epsilon-lactone hydrolase
VIYYLHGGGYIGGSAEIYRGLCKHLALRAGLSVYALDYPLAPEHKFPEAQLVAATQFQKLSKQYKRIIIMGDSAGGNLTLSLALKLMQDDPVNGLASVAGLVLLSPWLDLTHSGESAKSRVGIDPMIHELFLPLTSLQFVADPSQLSDPFVSPVFAPADQLNQLPPTLIHVGDYELLLDDSTRLYEKCDPSKTTLVIWEKMHHVHQLTVGLLQEADQSLNEIASFVKNLLQSKLSKL